MLKKEPKASLGHLGLIVALQSQSAKGIRLRKVQLQRSPRLKGCPTVLQSLMRHPEAWQAVHQDHRGKMIVILQL